MAKEVSLEVLVVQKVSVLAREVVEDRGTVGT
jgi:hypothetical protein